MLPETHPLITAATKPLADNAEQHLAARAMLEENFNPESPAIPETLARLEAGEENRRPAIWKIILWLVALTSLALAVHSRIATYRLMKGGYDLVLFNPTESLPLPQGLSEKQRLLLGDPALDPIVLAHRLHLSAPDNPAYYMEYAHAYTSGNKTLPPDFFETVSRIAPDNSFFLYFAAGFIGKDSFEKKASSAPKAPARFLDGVRVSPLPIEKEYTVTDQASFDEASSLLEKAAALPNFQTYTTTMMSERARIFEPSSGSMTDLMYRYAYIWSSPSAGIITLRHVADLMSARAEMLSKAGSTEEFVILANQRDSFIAGLSKNRDNFLIGELVYKVIASATATGLHAAAARLNLDEMERTYLAQRDGMQALHDQRNIQRKAYSKWFPEDGAGILAGSILPYVGNQAISPPPIRREDLKPLRLGEHDVASGLGVIAAAMVMLLACLPVLLFRFLSPRPVRLPAKRLSTLLRPADWAWIFLCGIILPLAIHLCINRLTPLGGRSYGLKHFHFLFPGVQLLAILLSLLLAPATLIRWRLAKRLAPFGLGSEGGKISAAILFLILLWSLSAYPVLVHFGLSRPLLIALAAVPMLWLGNVFLTTLRTFLGKPPQRILLISSSFALPAAHAAGIIALCLTLPLITVSEKHWLPQDTLFQLDPDAPDLGAYEFKVSAQVRKETNSALGIH